MWPEAASVKEARKRAEEEAAREAAARAEQEAKEAAERAEREAREAEKARLEAEREAKAQAEREAREAEKQAELEKREAEREAREAERAQRIAEREARVNAKREEAHRTEAEDGQNAHASRRNEEHPSHEHDAGSSAKTNELERIVIPSIEEDSPEPKANGSDKRPHRDTDSFRKVASDDAEKTKKEPAPEPRPSDAATTELPAKDRKVEKGEHEQEPAEHEPKKSKKSKKKHSDDRREEPEKSAHHGSEHAHAEDAKTPAERKGNGKKFAIAGIAAVVMIALVVLIVNLVPINVTVNGTEVQLSGSKNVGAAIEKAGLSPTPGNFVAVDGSVIKEGAGEPFSATIGDTQTSDPKATLANGESIEIANGGDITEDYTVTIEAAPFTAEVDGKGSVHSLSGEGKDGEQETRTGAVSGLQAVTITTDPTNVVCTYHNVDVDGQKVIALTFDDGPNAQYTPEILDVLEENDASATFFTLGYRITGVCVDVVKRAHDAGHQISTHSWDHADGSGQGVNLSYMSKDEQIDEILKGYEAIEAVTGEEASHIIRTPGGNFPPDVVANLSPYITSEIGWNIDTQDWQRPGVAAIKNALLSAKPGDIILMHDGGGDRSQTVQALSEALPTLRSRGYSFVTINQLLEMAQPASDGDDSESSED